MEGVNDGVEVEGVEDGCDVGDEVVGVGVGDAVGDREGETLGEDVAGAAVGEVLGAVVEGDVVGEFDGAAVGPDVVGEIVGDRVHSFGQCAGQEKRVLSEVHNVADSNDELQSTGSAMPLHVGTVGADVGDCVGLDVQTPHARGHRFTKSARIP